MIFNQGYNSKQKITKSSDVPPGCKTIFIRNLPYDATEDEVGNHFRRYGRIEQIRFAYNYANKKFKGFAYIDFENPAAVPEALLLNGKMIRGRPMEIDFCTTYARKGYKMNMSDDGNKMYNQSAKRKIVRDKKRKIKAREKAIDGQDFH